LGDATYHSRKSREEALKIYANGMSMRATKAVNRSIRTMMYSIALVLWEKKLIPEFVT